MFNSKHFLLALSLFSGSTAFCMDSPKESGSDEKDPAQALGELTGAKAVEIPPNQVMGLLKQIQAMDFMQLPTKTVDNERPISIEKMSGGSMGEAYKVELSDRTVYADYYGSCYMVYDDKGFIEEIPLKGALFYVLKELYEKT